MTRDDRGFTFIELMVTLVLLALLATISMRYFRPWQQRTTVESDTGAIHSLLQQARLKAFTEKLNLDVDVVNATRVCVSCDPADATCQARYGGNFTCVDTDLPVAGVGTPISITDRGFFSGGGTIHYNGGATLTHVYQSCVTVSATRVRMGSWNATTNTCTLK